MTIFHLRQTSFFFKTMKENGILKSFLTWLNLDSLRYPIHISQIKKKLYKEFNQENLLVFHRSK